MSITRMFRRPPGLGDAPMNEQTVVTLDPHLHGGPGPGPLDARALFLDRYPILQKSLQSHQKQGVLLVAFDERSTALGQAWLAASLDRTRALIVGRHSMCSMPLPPEHTSIALRHVAVLVRAVSHTEVRIRVLDLHTQSGFHDEEGRVLQAVQAEGPLFLRVGPVTLVFLVTGEAPPPASAEEAYAAIPPRVLLEERPGPAGAPPRRSAPARPHELASEVTFIRSLEGPVVSAAPLARPDEVPIASVVVRSKSASERRAVGAVTLERGFLVGRYDRCDVGISGPQSESRLSRVHLLVVKDGEDVLAVDAASTNGTFMEGAEISCAPIEGGQELDLGDELQLTWSWMS